MHDLHVVELLPFVEKYHLLLNPLYIHVVDLVFIPTLSCVFHEEISVVAVELAETQQVDFFVDLVEGEVFLLLGFLLRLSLA